MDTAYSLLKSIQASQLTKFKQKMGEVFANVMMCCAVPKNLLNQEECETKA